MVSSVRDNIIQCQKDPGIKQIRLNDKRKFLSLFLQS